MGKKPDISGHTGDSDGALRAKKQRAGPTNDFEPFCLSDIDEAIPRRFEKQVRRYGDATAVRSRGESLTYSELNETANRIAHAILEHIGEGEEPVALLLDQTARTIAAILGALKAGKIYVPINPGFPRARLAYMIEDSQAALVITDALHIATAAGLAPPEVPIIDVDALGAHLSTDNPGIAIAPQRKANIIYTSGSTGLPKGVLQNHRNLMFEMFRVTNSFHVCRSDRLALVHSCSSSASLRRIFPALLNGASLHMLDLTAAPLEDLPAWFADEEITISNGRRLLRDCKHLLTGQRQFPWLRLVTFGGEPVYASDVELYKRFLSPDCLMLVNLCTTETGSDRQYFIDKETTVESGLVPVGYATEGTEICLLDEDGRAVEAGQAGEIAVKSPYLSLGYWRKPELTRQRFVTVADDTEARTYLTGDIGRMSSDGCLFYLGRRDFQVKVRGYRIETMEVESALLNIGAFDEAVVTAIATGEETQDAAQSADAEEKRLVAFLVPAKLPAPDVGSLRRSLAETLPDYMIPSIFVMLERFPRAPSGKVDRDALTADFLRNAAWRVRPDVGCEFVAPRNPIEEVLTAIWAELLGVDAVGVNDAFLELGGDSLKAMRVLSRIRNEFQMELTPQALFEAPTVAKLAQTLVAHEPERGWVEDIASLRREFDGIPVEEVLAELRRLKPEGEK